MKNKNNFSDSKKCSKCVVVLPINQFYSKGKRLDSICKKCKKTRERTSYEVRKKRDDLKNLFSFASLICELEIKKTESAIRRLDKILRRYNVYNRL
jgi:hypothetical protein